MGKPLFYYAPFVVDKQIDVLHIEDKKKLWTDVPVSLRGIYTLRAESPYIVDATSAKRLSGAKETAEVAL